MVVLVKLAVDCRRDASHRLSSLPGEEMGDISVAVIGMLGREQAFETEQAVPEQVTVKGWCPAGVAPVEPPGELDKSG